MQKLIFCENITTSKRAALCYSHHSSSEGKTLRWNCIQATFQSLASRASTACIFSPAQVSTTPFSFGQCPVGCPWRRLCMLGCQQCVGHLTGRFCCSYCSLFFFGKYCWLQTFPLHCTLPLWAKPDPGLRPCTSLKQLCFNCVGFLSF